MKELDYEKVFDTLVEETANYVTSNGLKAMVLGISGGIDSTVVAAICHEVSKKTDIPLIGRSLPIKNKNDEFDVSKLVGQAFCNEFATIYIKGVYEELLDFITATEIDAPAIRIVPNLVQTPIANGNIQARLRMIYLYNLASIHKGLVMSTDNQTEYQLGFWTIHGDVGDFDPIQDLWKTEVYELAKWIYNYYFTKYSVEVTHDNREGVAEYAKMLDAIKQSSALTPTDGLGISNSDLEQIGAKNYNEVDDILQTMLTAISKSGSEWIDAAFYVDLCKKYSQEVVDKVWSRHLASEFKRKKAPIYITREKYEND